MSKQCAKEETGGYCCCNCEHQDESGDFECLHCKLAELESSNLALKRLLIEYNEQIVRMEAEKFKEEEES
jgi:hypothetical protein